MLYLRKHYPRGWLLYAAFWAVKASTHVVTWTARAALNRLRGDREAAALAREWASAFRQSIWPLAKG